MSNLTAIDLEMFAKFGIPAELIVKAQIERLDNRQARERLAVNGRTGDMAGIFIPSFNPRNGIRGVAVCVGINRKSKTESRRTNICLPTVTAGISVFRRTAWSVSKTARFRSF
jgi:hypothetical protein